MGTGNSGLFNKTKGSRSGNVLSLDLFSNESADHQAQEQSNIAQDKHGLGHEHGSYPEDIIIERMSSNIDIFQLFIIMCHMLRSKLAELKNKKILKFLNDFNNNNFLDSTEFQIFKEYFQNENIGTDYGYDAVRKFITKYLSDSSATFMKLRKNEWISYVAEYFRKST